MDEQQTVTAEQIWEDVKPYIIAGLKEDCAYYREGNIQDQTMQRAYLLIQRMSLAKARKARGKQ